jgi:hypothetical protein
MNIREQLDVLLSSGVEFVVVGGQAGVLRQAIEFSHDLDILIRPTEQNAERVRLAVRKIANVDPDPQVLLGRDFQQYIDESTGTEIDVHLKLIALPTYEVAALNASDVEVAGLRVFVLELPALYAAKRTDRPRDAVHRRAIEDRLRSLVLRNLILPDEIVLALCLDDEVSRLPMIAPTLEQLSSTTSQPLLQVRLIALGVPLAGLQSNPTLHETPASLLALDRSRREKLVAHPSRFATLLARVPLLLPAEGYRVRWRAR